MECSSQLSVTVLFPLTSREGEPESYEILSIFPQHVYDDNSMTLEKCGLVPNASLLLRKKAPPEEQM